MVGVKVGTIQTALLFGGIRQTNGELITTETIEVAEDLTLYAIWERVPYKVTFNANGGAGEMATVDCYTDSYTLPSCEFTPPSSNYEFKGWALTENGAVIADEKLFMQQDVTLYAIWGEKESFVITASAGSGGTISLIGQNVVNGGESLTFTITPNSGYTILDVLVNGVSVGAVSSYTFENVNQNCTISVSFTETAQPPVVGPETPTTPGGDGSSAGSAGCSKTDSSDLTSVTFMCLFAVLAVALTKKKRYA